MLQKKWYLLLIYSVYVSQNRKSGEGEDLSIKERQDGNVACKEAFEYPIDDVFRSLSRANGWQVVLKQSEAREAFFRNDG